MKTFALYYMSVYPLLELFLFLTAGLFGMECFVLWLCHLNGDIKVSFRKVWPVFAVFFTALLLLIFLPSSLFIKKCFL